MRITIIFFILLCFTFFYQKELFPLFSKINFNSMNSFLNERIKIKSIKIENLQLLDEKQILEKINLKDSNLLNLNLKSLKEQLMRIDEIETLSIEKKINGDINILVQEKKPFVFWEVDGKRFLIDTKGTILNYKNYKNNDLKIVTGKLANLHANSIINKINLFPKLNLKFQSADYVENYRWDINLSNNVKVKLPFEDNENIALNFLDNLIKNENFEIFEKKVIDLRVIGRAFVK